jgi:hypothetical protein
MRGLQNCKFATAITAGPVSSNDTAVGTYVDTLGAGYLTLIFQLGTTTVDMSAIKLQESNTTSAFNDISGAALTGATFSATSDGSIGIIGIPLDGTRMRYINFVADPGAAATIMAGIFVLSDLNQTPNSDTERGVLQSVFVA